MPRASARHRPFQPWERPGAFVTLAGMDSDARALARTAAILAAVSLFRWGWTTLRPLPELGEPVSTVALLDSSRALAATAEERSEPLAPGERLDPNRAGEAQLDRLPGVGPATAAEIVRERESAGAYTSLDDLTRVRGVGPATLEKLREHLEIGTIPPRLARPRTGRGGTPATVDVNRADAAQLTALPGVGPALAARIVEARATERFGSVDDLARVRGIGPATLERLRPLVVAR